MEGEEIKLQVILVYKCQAARLACVKAAVIEVLTRRVPSTKGHYQFYLWIIHGVALLMEDCGPGARRARLVKNLKKL